MWSRTKGFVVWMLIFIALALFELWMFAPLNQDQTASGTKIKMGGWFGGYMTVKADSDVCVKGISDENPFEVETPSGRFIPTEEIGIYFYGEGCYAPGTWNFTGTVPAMVMTNPDGVSATSFTPLRVKATNYGMIGFIGLVCLFGYRITVGHLPRRQTEEPDTNGLSL